MITEVTLEMLAVVLTYDKYIKLTDHMIQSYETKWPSHPFTFRVPYNNHYPKFLKRKYEEKVEIIKAPEAIKATVLKLLEGIKDEEWIYWCIDDKYLIDIEESGAKDIYQWIKSIEKSSIDGISFVRARNLTNNALTGEKYINNHGRILHRRKDYSQIWLHQFLKAKILRYLFNSMPEDIGNAKKMDYLINNEIKLPKEHKLYVTTKNMAVLGESTTRGKLTKNCVQSFRKNGMKLPEGFDLSQNSIKIGNMCKIPSLPPYLESRIIYVKNKLRRYI